MGFIHLERGLGDVFELRYGLNYLPSHLSLLGRILPIFNFPALYRLDFSFLLPSSSTLPSFYLEFSASLHLLVSLLNILLRNLPSVSLCFFFFFFPLSSSIIFAFIQFYSNQQKAALRFGLIDEHTDG